MLRRAGVRAAAGAVVLAMVASGCEAVVRSSQSATGAEGNGASVAPDLSGDGRYVVFESAASNLVPNDTNGVSDVFLKDHWTGAVERVSVNAVGTQGNGPSTDPAVSDDGRYVVFTTEATNLVLGDTNGVSDVVLYDREVGVPSILSKDASGVLGDGASSQPDISASGTFVTFASDAANLAAGADNGFRDVFLRNLAMGTIENVSGRFAAGGASDGDSYDPVIGTEYVQMPEDASVDVLFTSDASNIGVSCGTQTPGVSDVFLFMIGPYADMFQSRWVIDGIDAPAGSPAASMATRAPYWAAFVSEGQLYVANTWTESHDRCRVDPPILVSRGPDGQPGDGASTAPEAVAVGTSANKVAFVSEATNLVPGDTNGVADVFVWDQSTGEITRVSANTPGQANGDSATPSLSRDGRFVAFASDATNFGSDTNGVTDVFARPIVPVRATSVAPTSAGAGQTVDVTVTGTGLGPGATLDFGPGITVQSVTPVNSTQVAATITIDAAAAAGPRSVHVEQPPGGSATCTDCFVVTATTPTLVAGDVTVTEGSDWSTTILDVTVTLGPAAADTVTVDYATADRTAVFLPLGDRDYAAASGTLTFAPGETSKTITLLVAGDNRVEGDETFTVELSNPAPAGTLIAKATATVTIVDDD